MPGKNEKVNKGSVFLHNMSMNKTTGFFNESIHKTICRIYRMEDDIRESSKKLSSTLSEALFLNRGNNNV